MTTDIAFPANDWDGPVLFLTDSDEATLGGTLSNRLAVGPVTIIDPDGSLFHHYAHHPDEAPAGWDQTERYTFCPLAGVDTPEEAMRVAAALVAMGPQRPHVDTYWDRSAEDVLGRLLLLAVETSASLDEVIEWASTPPTEDLPQPLAPQVAILRQRYCDQDDAVVVAERFVSLLDQLDVRGATAIFARIEEILRRWHSDYQPADSTPGVVAIDSLFDTNVSVYVVNYLPRARHTRLLYRFIALRLLESIGSIEGQGQPPIFVSTDPTTEIELTNAGILYDREAFALTTEDSSTAAQRGTFS